jgi:GDP-L-fucose synthase
MVINLYESVAKTCKKAVIINPVSNCVYPAVANLYSEDALWNGPMHPSVVAFGETRRLLLSLGQTFDDQYGVKSIQLIVPNMYGPYESTDPTKAHALNALVAKFVKAKHENTDVEIWGTGKAVREWLYGRDFARILLEVINDPDKKELTLPTNIAQKHGLSIKELADIIKSNFPSFKGSIVWNTKMQDGAAKKIMDNTKFKKIFPDFDFTPFEEGLRNTIEYYESLYPYGK